MKHSFTEPELLVDDHHGIYMGQYAYGYLMDYVKEQIQAQLSEYDIQAIEAGPDHEWHHEAVDDMMDLTLKDKYGVEFQIMFAEGGVWAVPISFLEDEEKSNAFFGN